jgi:hypothetical protein
MKEKIIISIFLSMLMFVSIFAGAMNVVDISSSNDGIQVPVWDVGDKWTYTISTSGEKGSELDFDVTLDNFILEVTDVLTDRYELSVSIPRGDFRATGSVDVDLLKISGSLKNTMADGTMYIRKSDLALMNLQLNIDGETNKIILPSFTADLDINFYDDTFNSTNLTSLQFPLNVDDSWTASPSYVIVDAYHNILPDVLPNPISIYNYVEEHFFSCMGWESVEGYYSLKISRNSQSDNLWYSPATGSIVKVDYADIDLGFGYLLEDFSMTLKSTTYEAPTDPPETPSAPTGEDTLDVGSTESYSTSSTDPDGDMISYKFNFGDGVTKTTDFYSSGEEVTVSHTWDSDGTFEFKVKAVDIYGAESDWSEPLTVEVSNDAPTKPTTPEGPAEGKIKQSYSYSTSSSDPNGHKIKYGWDWNGDKSVDEWTGLKNSGDTVTTSHTYNSQGDYTIHVISEDEYGKQGEWSDPLSTTMPKSKLKRFNILEKILEIIEGLEEIFQQTRIYDLLN